MESSPSLPVALIVPCTEAEGPGRRFAVWLQGCPLRCPGCCNPEMLPFDGRTPTPVAELAARVREARRCWHVEGLTLLGGEPTAHPGTADLAEAVRDLGLSVMVFSGYTLAELRTAPSPTVARLLAATDVLVDGRYDRRQPESDRRWVGSRNQVVHALSGRYDLSGPAWRLPQTLELRLRQGVLTVNGFPGARQASLWRRIALTAGDVSAVDPPAHGLAAGANGPA